MNTHASQAYGTVAAEVIARLRHLQRQWDGRRYLATARQRAMEILSMVPPVEEVPAPSTWVVQRAAWTDTGIPVLSLGTKGGPPCAILRLPKTDAQVAIVQRHIHNITRLRNETRIGDWRRFLPTLIIDGVKEGQVYAVERALPGQRADTLLRDPRNLPAVQTAAVSTITELHQRTSSPILVDGVRLERWINEPLQLMGRTEGLGLDPRRKKAALDRIAEQLHEGLAGRRLEVSWIHGDYWPGNVLVEGRGRSLTGIVDWDLASPDELPQHDILHFLLYTRRVVQRRELGDLIGDKLDGEAWDPFARSLLDSGGWGFPANLEEERLMVVLYWLRHIASNLTQSVDNARNRWWVAKNIDSVLRRM